MSAKKFPWLFSVLWLSILVLMLRLGFWQLQRADEKQLLIDQLAQTEHPVIEGVSALQQVHRFQTIEVLGSFDEKVAFYLSNQFHDGQVGFHVYGVMSYFESDVISLVNRGWVKDLSSVPQAQPAEKLWLLQQSDWPRPGVQLGDQVLTSSAKQQVTYLTEEVTKNWLKERFCRQKTNNDCIILPFIFKLNQQMPDGFVRDWKSQRVVPEKHQAYAGQWFSMSLVLLLLYFVFLRKNHASED